MTRFAPIAAILLLLGLLAPAAANAALPVDKLATWFFTSPRLSGVEISPSGTHVAALYSEQGKELIVVRELDGGAAVPLVTLPDPEARLRWLSWANDERILFSVEEPMPSRAPPRPRRTRLYGINKDGSGHLHLAKNWNKSLLMGRGSFQFEDTILDMLDDAPNHVLIQIRKPTENYPGAYRLDVRSGGLDPVVGELEGVRSWHADHSGVIRAGTGYLHKKMRLFARPTAEAEFIELSASGLFDERGLTFEGFGFDPNVLYVSRYKNGFSALYEYDLATQSLGEELFAMEGFDVPGRLEFSEQSKKLTAAVYLTEGWSRHFFDDEARSSQEALDRALPRSYNRIVSETADRHQAVVMASGDTLPPTYYLFDRKAKKLTFLFSTLPALGAVDLAPMKAVSYAARDGMTIPAFLTLPSDHPDGQNLPLVVYPHGGPSARDVWGWDATTQYLAALGFAVLQPNFRGSTGYGSAHWTAGLQEWGLAMQDDVSDGVKWLVETGVVDPKRVCIFGSSYGGYTALMGLVRTPELFRCAASYAGPSDLVMMLNHDKGYIFSEVNVPTVGSTSQDRARLKDNSPLQNIEKFRAPVLLAHGEDDERVHVAHSEKLAKALDKAGKPVEMILLEDEAHSFRDEGNRIGFFRALGEFLLEHTAAAGDRVAESP
jgi:dipeptidyl aminopeptidase/acylaminoacyl peptidase